MVADRFPDLSQDYYSLLGLSPTASPTDIRQAYREMSKQYHPDTTVLAAEVATRKFQQIQDAYATLSNPEQRRQYDLWRTYLAKRVAVALAEAELKVGTSGPSVFYRTDAPPAEATSPRSAPDVTPSSPGSPTEPPVAASTSAAAADPTTATTARAVHPGGASVFPAHGPGNAPGNAPGYAPGNRPESPSEGRPGPRPGARPEDYSEPDRDAAEFYSSSAYLDAIDRPLSAGEVFALFLLGVTFVGCIVLAVALGIARGEFIVGEGL